MQQRFGLIAGAGRFPLIFAEEARAQGLGVTNLVDVVISDVEMPVMDGYTLCKSIKDDPALAALQASRRTK